MKQGRLAGKIAFVTGTAQGTGRAAAILFAAEGAKIIGCDLKTAESNATVNTVKDLGGEMTSFHPLDLTDPEKVEQWVMNGVELYGGVDILFNNAAMSKFGWFDSLPASDWAFTFKHEVDLFYYVTKAVWPQMIKRGGGSIINMASMSGLTGDPNLGQAAHAAAKGAVIGLTRQLAAEGAKHGIRANSISPGPIATPAAQWTDELAKYVRSTNPSGRAGKAEDIAPYALFLASDESSWVTGTNLSIDGGLMNILAPAPHLFLTTQ